jgi:hypothetical protein
MEGARQIRSGLMKAKSPAKSLRGFSKTAY